MSFSAHYLFAVLLTILSLPTSLQDGITTDVTLTIDMSPPTQKP